MGGQGAGIIWLIPIGVRSGTGGNSISVFGSGSGATSGLNTIDMSSVVPRNLIAQLGGQENLFDPRAAAGVTFYEFLELTLEMIKSGGLIEDSVKKSEGYTFGVPLAEALGVGEVLDGVYGGIESAINADTESGAIYAAVLLAARIKTPHKNSDRSKEVVPLV